MSVAIQAIETNGDTDGHIWELYWESVGGWHGGDLTAATAAGDPAAIDRLQSAACELIVEGECDRRR